MNAVNKYDHDTIKRFRNNIIDIKDCCTNEIKRIIINDNEDDNYYKKNILGTINLIIAKYVNFYNYFILLDIDYLKEYWKIEEVRISKSIIAEESFYLIEQK